MFERPVVFSRCDQTFHPFEEGLSLVELVGKGLALTDGFHQLRAELSGLVEDRRAGRFVGQLRRQGADASHGPAPHGAQGVQDIRLDLVAAASARGHHRRGVGVFQGLAVDQAATAVQHRFDLGGDAGDVVRAGQDDITCSAQAGA